MVQEWKMTQWPKGYASSRSEFTLKAKNGETELKMAHSRVPAEQVGDYRKGWYVSCWTLSRSIFEKTD